MGLWKLWIPAFCLCAFTVSGQQVSFKGTVQSRSGQPLPGAIITLLPGKKNLVADSNGQFIFTPDQAGRWKVQVTHTGYIDQVKEIQAPGEHLFSLEETEQQLEQVVVTAVAGATRIKRTPVSIAIVSQKEMLRSTSSNVIDAVLKAVPGISAITTGPNISKPVIRGLGYTRVLTLYDGLRQEGQQWGDEHGVEIDQYGIARAEIVKGPASLMYGSDAIAGVVNLIPALPVIADKKLHGDAVTEYQSNNRMIGASASLNQHNNNFLWSLRASLKSAIDYQNKIDDRVYNTGFAEFNASAQVGWEKTKFKQYLQANLYDNFQEIPDGSRDSLTRRFTYQLFEADKDDIRNRPPVSTASLLSRSIAALHQHIQHYRLYHRGSSLIGGGEFTTLFGFQQNRRREYNHPTAANQPGLDVQLNTWNYEVKYNFADWGSWKLTSGINGMYQVNSNCDATDFPIPDYRLFDIGSYLVLKKEFRKLVFTGGLRVDSRHIKWDDFFTRKDVSGFVKQVAVTDTIGATLSFPAYSRDFSGISGSFGLVYDLSPAITIKANLARGYRCPSIPEIGSDGLDPGARIYYIGNRDFRPEFNWQSDVGIFFNGADADLHFEFFNNNITDYIFFQKLFDSNGQPLEIVPGNFTYQYRQGSARLYGAETGWVIHPMRWSWLQFQQNIAWINGLNTDQEALKSLGDQAKYLPLIPPFKTNSRLRISSASKRNLREQFMQVELETTARQDHYYAVDNTETATPGYALVNISAGLTLHNSKNKPVCNIGFAVNNLFDVSYQAHQNRLKYFEYYQQSTNGRYGIYNMGRNIAVKISFSW